MAETHYDSRYFAWNSSVSDVGAVLNRRKFEGWVKPGDTVLDFGCGNGALLAALPGVKKIGVDVGEPAREAASARGIETHSHTAAVAAESVDVVISNHALEHVTRPLDELRELRRVLKSGGVAVLVVPIDSWRQQRAPDPSDPNHHLYTWTPLLFANLLADAGFDVERCDVLTHAWKRKSLLLYRTLPRPLYDTFAYALAVTMRRRQIHAVARRPHQ